MNKREFNEFIRKGFVFLDGATGSNLVKKGFKSGMCPEAWILDNPEVMIELQKEYIKAGSSIVLAPTFTANSIKLKEYGLQDKVVEINDKLVALSKKAAGNDAYVAADISMTGITLSPMGTVDFEELVDVYKEQISILVKAGVDLIDIETMMSLQETRAALIAAKEVCDLPVICTLTFEEDGRTLYGTDGITAAVTLEALGADAVGANCSSGPSAMAKVISQMSNAVNIPIIAKPNAGLPSLNSAGETVYSLGPEEFAQEAEELVKAGATILGGCCGTDPSYIKALKEMCKKMDFVLPKQEGGQRFLSSERKTISFSENDPFIIVGERINPTGKKAFQAQLKDGCLDLALQFAEEQEENGALVLDINVGMGGIDEKEMMQKMLEAVSVHSSLPLSIDTSSVEVLENALRRYPGRALVNSVSAESAVMIPKLKIAQKYGAMIIALPLKDSGLPANLSERTENIEIILKEAYSMGFKKEDIVIDGLVSTVAASPESAKDILSTIKYAKENGLATTCGLSNISFGLPQRPFVNTAFLTMAIKEGLTMAIMNPMQELLVNAAFSADLLMNKQNSASRYIERMSTREYNTFSGTVKNDVNKSEQSQNSDLLFEDVLKGNQSGIVQHTKDIISEGKNPKEILNESLLPAIDRVGELFNDGKYFLPQLIASAESMKESIEYLEPLLLSDDKKENLPTVILATVKGDIHDIGKNLVALMLRNHGFKVIDLGKDVEAVEIVDSAIKNNASIIGLSALMTTTMVNMKEVIALAREKCPLVKIMVGGAVITDDYAKEIGADGYSKDAADAVIVAKKLANC